MLKWRVITGIIMISFAIACILFLSNTAFITITTAIMLFATWEFSKLIDCKSYISRTLYTILIAILMYIAWYTPIKLVLIAGLIWWLIALFLIISYPKTLNLWGKSIFTKAIIGALTLIPSWLSLIIIRSAQNGTIILIFVFCLIWGADIGAYFTGKKWGKNKLIPMVSPKKTWQGLFGGLLLTLVVAVIGCIVFNIPLGQWVIVIAISLITALFSVIGDLLESMLKRNANMKDSGSYLPGHGGLMDRIDSFTAAMPIFLLGCVLFGLITY